MSVNFKIRPGKPYPLGARWDGVGVNFAIFSEHAERVELCLFESPNSTKEFARIEMPEKTDYIWHVYLPDVYPGQLYGYRVYGPYSPSDGLRFNPSKVLIDPYARLILRASSWHMSWFDYDRNLYSSTGKLEPDFTDNAFCAPLSVVCDDAFPWEDDRRPSISWKDTVIYEAHVKGMTYLHPEVPEKLRGKYLGLATDPVIRHLKDIGVTTIELMPVHQHIDEFHLQKRGLTNYWGYNTIGFFAPDVRFSISDPVREFKAMVKKLHASNIEVILDVVYNHTAEGDHTGPTLSFRGIDNPVYYRLHEEDKSLYVNFSGCGNSLNSVHPRVLQFIMDSLRYWVLEMHVDGFRFDLASVLARGCFEFDRFSTFLGAISQDPVISRVKLIAEPWDLSEGGYQVGEFPAPWSEWNGKYRDAVRRFWNFPSPFNMSEMATRIAGSSDLYERHGKKTYASINFITSHDGFTLHDLVSYNEKHNKANMEDNKDGDPNNISYNYGVEGPTDNPEILDIRYRQKRNFMATLFLSIGVPMILGGDELGRSQNGNNNAYCQDNEISWYRWDIGQRDKEFLNFIRKLFFIRKEYPVFRRTNFFKGQKPPGAVFKDITWIKADGSEMTRNDWYNRDIKAFGAVFGGDAIGELDGEGNKIISDTVLLLFHFHRADFCEFILPVPFPEDSGFSWKLLLDTSFDQMPEDSEKFFLPGSSYRMLPSSMAVFVLKPVK